MKSAILRLACIPLTLAAVAAFSHVGFVIRGIHLKGTPADFGVPPRKYGFGYDVMGMDDGVAWRPGTSYWYEDDVDGDGNPSNTMVQSTRKLMLKGRAFEQSGKFAQATGVYRDMLHRGLGGVSELKERIELLSHATSSTKGVGVVLASIGSGATRRLPMPNEVAASLKPFVAYHRADDLADRDARANAFVIVAERYPSSSRAEPALIMAARTALAEGDQAVHRDLRRAIASAALSKLLSSYPSTRFRCNAVGWQARLSFLSGDFSTAEAKYRQQLSLAATLPDKQSALDSIANCAASRGRIDLAAAAYLQKFGLAKANPYTDVYALRGALDEFKGLDARRFSLLLGSDPDLLVSYLSYRIQFTDLTPDVLQFGTTKAARNPQVALRLAEAAIKLEKTADARKFVDRACGGKLSDEQAALAQFIQGTLALRTGNRELARAKFSAIASRNTYLANGAMENLILIAERQGRLGDALDLYNKLGYQQDFAYLVDARMTTAELASYLHRKDACHRPLLTYTLGMRYLRESNWDAADRTFKKLTTAQRSALTAPPAWYISDTSTQDPLATLTALRSLDHAAKAATDGEARAAALYKLASYYYTHGSLLLYSPQLWNGDRAYSIGFSWNANSATEVDQRALSTHHSEHESLMHALRICQSIVKNYPKTAAAGPAAYRGACAAERLSNLSAYWRWVDYQKDIYGESVRLMKLATDDPNLGKAAAKYGVVFAEERKEARADVQWNESLPMRQFHKDW